MIQSGDCASVPSSDSALGHSPVAGSHSAGRKRSLPPSPIAAGTCNRRKTTKIRRACDFCKSKKLRCNGTLPCSTCVKRSLACLYNAKYSRGRPPTPPIAHSGVAASADLTRSSWSQTAPRWVGLDLSYSPMGLMQQETHSSRPLGHADPRLSSRASPAAHDDVPPSRSPELDTSEIDGQFFEPTSGVAFLHEASRRLLAQRASVPDVLTGSERSQPLMAAGDPPLADEEPSFTIPSSEVVRDLVGFYFDDCVVTYQMLHRQSVVCWAEAMLSASQRGQPLTDSICPARASIVLTIFAIVTFRRGRIARAGAARAESDRFFRAAMHLTNTETGLPRLVSAQARLIQVLYLLQTSRMNQAWYQFGMTSQIISALGLHRRSRRRRSPLGDYIDLECGKRTFWVAYTIDRYLTVVFGRPRHYHDEDIDQGFPESINDESMAAQGPSEVESLDECHIDALVAHARLAQIIGVISRDVYSLKRPQRQRISSARDALLNLSKWRSELPPHLGTVKPSSLIPIFRRQAIALKLAHAHSIIHVSRPFLLGRWGSSADETEIVERGIEECLSAAKTALQTYDGMVSDGSLAHAFWWASYVAFCALAVVYILDIQLNSSDRDPSAPSSHLLTDVMLELAERCRSHLSSCTMTDTPSRRYSIILEGLRHGSRQQHGQSRERSPLGDASSVVLEDQMFQRVSEQDGAESDGMDFLSGWQTTDWLELDASALGPFNYFDLDL